MSHSRPPGAAGWNDSEIIQRPAVMKYFTAHNVLPPVPSFVVSSRNNVLDERTLCQNTILVRFHTCQSVFFSVVSPTSGRGNNGKFFYLSVSMSSLDRPSGSGQAASSSCGCSPVNMLIFPAMNPATLSAGNVRSSFNCPSYRPKVLLS